MVALLRRCSRLKRSRPASGQLMGCTVGKLAIAFGSAVVEVVAVDSLRGAPG